MESVSFICVTCKEKSSAPDLDTIIKHEKKCPYCFKLEKERNRMAINEIQGLVRRRNRFVQKTTKEALVYRCVSCGYETKPTKHPVGKCGSCTRKAMSVVKDKNFKESE